MPESRAYYHDLRDACAEGGCPLWPNLPNLQFNTKRMNLRSLF